MFRIWASFQPNPIHLLTTRSSMIGHISTPTFRCQHLHPRAGNCCLDEHFVVTMKKVVISPSLGKPLHLVPNVVISKWISGNNNVEAEVLSSRREFNTFFLFVGSRVSQGGTSRRFRCGGRSAITCGTEDAVVFDSVTVAPIAFAFLRKACFGVELLNGLVDILLYLT